MVHILLRVIRCLGAGHVVRIWFALAVLSVVAWVPAVQAQQSAILLPAMHAGQPLAGSVGYLVDESETLTLEQARAAHAAGRFAFAAAPLVWDGDARPVWFAMALKQVEPFRDWVLTLPATSIQDLRFYGPFDAAGQALATPVVTGSLHPFASRSLSSEQLAMRMLLPEPGTYTVYVRAISLTSRVYDFSVWDIADFNAASQNKRIFDGVCYGILLAMLVYNLVLLLVFRDRTYALYVLSGTFALLTLASFNGHTAHFLFPTMPVLADRMNVVFPALWIALGLLFAQSFLDLKRYAPRIELAALAIAAVALGNALVGSLGFQTLAQAINEYTALAGTGLIFAGALLSWKGGFPPARWYLGGQFALFVSVILTVVHNWGYIDWPFISDNGLQIGVSIEVMVFAVALGSRIRLMQALQSELKVRADHLEVVSETDPLTGIANRAGLAQQALTALVQPHQRALILLDLDKFKPVNDQYGHAAGDAVLVEVARRLKSQVRDGDTVARVGGDEFVILLRRAYDRKTLELISRRLIDVIAQPVMVGGRGLVVGSSLGIARYPGNGLTLADLLRAADTAMYHTKKKGRAGFSFFDDLSAQDTQVAAQGADPTRWHT